MAFAPSYDQDFANIGGADYGYGGGPAVNGMILIQMMVT